MGYKWLKLEVNDDSDIVPVDRSRELFYFHQCTKDENKELFNKMVSTITSNNRDPAYYLFHSCTDRDAMQYYLIIW